MDVLGQLSCFSVSMVIMEKNKLEMKTSDFTSHPVCVCFQLCDCYENEMRQLLVSTMRKRKKKNHTVPFLWREIFHGKNYNLIGEKILITNCLQGS